MKIMIVDDSTAMRMIVRKTLRLAGFEGHDFSEADDGMKALAAIKASPPDLVLSDWNMPNMTGIELLEALTKAGIKVKFGFVTTEATPDMRQRATAAGKTLHHFTHLRVLLQQIVHFLDRCSAALGDALAPLAIDDHVVRAAPVRTSRRNARSVLGPTASGPPAWF